MRRFATSPNFALTLFISTLSLVISGSIRIIELVEFDRAFFWVSSSSTSYTDRATTFHQYLIASKKEEQIISIRIGNFNYFISYRRRQML